MVGGSGVPKGVVGLAVGGATTVPLGVAYVEANGA
jgi:hypothetical protein